jgi:hypothetical protein
MLRSFGLDSLAIESLERKLSLSTVGAHGVLVIPHDDVDDPETDPGDLPIDDTPIVLPPVPPSGPVGPG